MKKFISGLFLFLALGPDTALSQQSNFVNYSIESGLSQSTVFSITQDKRGYLWFGTDGGGVSRFDGFSFKNFTKKNGLSGNIVRSILEDHAGNLWFGTDEGVTFYNGLKFRTINQKNGLTGSKVLKIFEDSGKNIWATTDDGGINRINIRKDSVIIKGINASHGLSTDFIFDIKEDKFKRLWLASFYGGIDIITFKGTEFEIKNISKPQIPGDLITCIEEDKEGNFWFGTYDAGVFKITPSKDGIGDMVSYHSGNGLRDNGVWDILADERGNMWFGTNTSGLVKLSVNKKKAEFSYYTIQNGLPNNQVLSLKNDSEGNLWIGTNGSGVCKFQGDRFVHFTENEGLSKNLVNGITQDKNKNIFLATRGGGMVRLNFENGKPVCKIYNTSNGLVDNDLRSISIAPDGNIWVATTNGISKFNGSKFTNYNENDGLVHNAVNCIYADRKGIIWCGTSGGLSRFDGKKFRNSTKEGGFVDNDVQAIIEDKYGNIWFGTMGGLAKYQNNTLVTYDEVEGLNFKEINCLSEDTAGNIWIGTRGAGIYVFLAKEKSRKSIKQVAAEGILSSNIIYSLAFLNSNTLIAGTDKGFDKISLNDSLRIVKIVNYSQSDGFIGVENNQNAIYKDSNGHIWFGTSKVLTRYSAELDKQATQLPRAHITMLKLGFDNVNWAHRSDTLSPWFNLPKDLKLKHSDNRLTFRIAGLSHINPQKVSYKYILEGWDTDWSPAVKDSIIPYSNLSPGDYTFKVLAIDGNGKSSEPAIFSFIINPPWYKTTWFYAICFISIAASFYGFIKFRERNLKAEKKILEDKVLERTSEVVKQKEVIEEKNKDITDSINYAKRIQTAILPDLSLISTALPESFVLFKPKDIVSGDFYFFTKSNVSGKPYYTIAAVDCTGHGVPGAFMSMIGSSLLNQIIREKKIIQPSEILNQLHEGVREALKQHDSESETRDGMDIALCTINLETKEIQYSGANRPLYVIKNNILEELKADKFPIGGLQSEDRRTFSNHAIQLKEGDSFYLTTDGYADQFGGAEGKKFMTKKLKTLLQEMQSKPMQEMKEELNKTIENWMGNYEQVDDICVIGVGV